MWYNKKQKTLNLCRACVGATHVYAYALRTREKQKSVGLVIKQTYTI